MRKNDRKNDIFLSFHNKLSLFYVCNYKRYINKTVLFNKLNYMTFTLSFSCFIYVQYLSNVKLSHNNTILINQLAITKKYLIPQALMQSKCMLLAYWKGGRPTHTYTTDY